MRDREIPIRRAVKKSHPPTDPGAARVTRADAGAIKPRFFGRLDFVPALLDQFSGRPNDLAPQDKPQVDKKIITGYPQPIKVFLANGRGFVYPNWLIITYCFI